MHKSKNNHKLIIEYLRGVDKVKWTESILDRFAMGADLPGEKMPGLPLLEIVGQNRVLIENHKETSVLSEVLSSLVLLRFCMSGSVFS